MFKFRKNNETHEKLQEDLKELKNQYIELENLYKLSIDNNKRRTKMFNQIIEDLRMEKEMLVKKYSSDS
jgi:hypothetical protein